MNPATVTIRSPGCDTDHLISDFAQAMSKSWGTYTYRHVVQTAPYDFHRDENGHATQLAVHQGAVFDKNGWGNDKTKPVGDFAFIAYSTSKEPFGASYSGNEIYGEIGRIALGHGLRKTEQGLILDKPCIEIAFVKPLLAWGQNSVGHELLAELTHGGSHKMHPNGYPVRGMYRLFDILDTGIIVKGSDTHDRIHAHRGPDFMKGGQGPDTFVFSWRKTGHDTIADFNTDNDSPERDLIQFSSSVFRNFTDVRKAMKQIGFDVRIEIDQDNTITIEGIRLDDLDEHDFVFWPPPPPSIADQT